ncbi:hypothetical protein BpHYR1_023104 [Brachionus plicatilis]|uniref:Uncharacterized protein n=1 Tax=Brachionus plicatilis TaxID=10195 RepID=A0A3M7PLC5_BRAPC|nr:hypothetical protein BpHYR1_023104 [Brachionus plicatilis]
MKKNEIIAETLGKLKTSNERELIRYLSNNTKTWVDSFIDSLGEVNKWGDGTNVTGFRNGQPGNEVTLTFIL